jgi:3-phosphoshikimate 1-carboxyvinyltransferase
MGDRMRDVAESSRVAGLQGTVRPPSDKSLTHRALLFAAGAGAGSPRASQTSVIEEPLDSEDAMATAGALVELGADIEFFEAEAGRPRMAVVQSIGRPDTPSIPLDCGNSGTSMRLLMGWAAGQDGLECVLDGDGSLRKRPMARVAEPLRRMGAVVEGETAPVRVSGRSLRGIEHDSPVASAQVKSAVLLAGLHAHGTTVAREPALSRDHTERMLEGLLGIELERPGPLAVAVRGPCVWPGFHYRIPGDVSSAAFWLVAAAMLPGSDVRLGEVGLNPTRTGVLDVLEAAGAKVAIENLREEGGEPVGELRVMGGRGLAAFRVEGEAVPRLLDEIPVLAVLATQCDGLTTFADAAELRVKESDRIESTVALVNAMGGSAEALADGLAVRGPSRLRGGNVEAAGDHRIAMAALVAGLVADGTTRVTGAGTIATSYPRFLDDLAALSAV